MSSVVIAGDTSGTVTLAAPAVAGSTTLTLPATTGNIVTDTATQTLTNKTLTSPTIGSSGITFSDGSTQTAAASPYVLKNRIINGACVIAQYGTTSLTVDNTAVKYGVDRMAAYGNIAASKFTVQQNAGSVTPPVGYTKYLGATSSSAYAVAATDVFYVYQRIEGFNIADLAWGTANAKTITLSFQVYSSLTGTFGGSIANGGETRSYAFSYSIPTANTWTTISVTIPGDTSGTWTSDNTAGMEVNFSLGAGTSRSGTANTWTASMLYQPTGATSVVGTSGATWYVTGVQLEIGSTATTFERRLYNQELANCQRYYYNYVNAALGVANPIGISANFSTTRVFTVVKYPVTMRTTPTISATGGTGYYAIYYNGTVTGSNVAPFLSSASPESYTLEFTPASAVTLNAAGFTQTSGVGGFISFTAEL